jgi:hypothetical protein
MKDRVLIASACAVLLLVPYPAWCQTPWPVSLELGLGRGSGHTSGVYLANGGGLTADAVLASRVHDQSSGGLVVAVGVGIQGAGPYDGVCLLKPEGGCIASFPEFTMASALLGWETSNTVLRLLAGPGYVVSGDGGLALQGRVNLVLPLVSRLGIGASVRGALVPKYDGESFTLVSGQLLLRIR